MSIRIAVLCIAAALVVPARAGTLEPGQGFTPGHLVSAARAGEQRRPWQLERARVLRAQTDTLRAGLVLNPDLANAALTRDEQAALRVAIGPRTSRTSAQLSWLARGARVAVAPGPEPEVSGLYNPIADAWLLLRWQSVAGAWRIDAARLVPGPELRPIDEATFWADQHGALTDALQAAEARALRRFEELFRNAAAADGVFLAPVGRSAGSRAGVLRSCDRWLASLARWATEPGHLARVRELRAALGEGGDALPEEVRALPTQVRATFLPTAGLATDAGERLLWVSPLAPQLVLLTDSGAESAAVGAPAVEQVSPVTGPRSLLPLVAVAGAARYRLSASPGLLLATSPQPTALVFAGLMNGPGLLWGEQAWSDLVGGAVQQRRENGDRAQTIWFNPLYDSAVLVDWHRTEGEWIAVAASVVLGETIRSDSSIPEQAGATGWLDAPGGFARALEASSTATLAALERLPEWSVLAVSPALQRTVALMRVNRATGSTVLLRDATPRFQGIADALQRLAVLEPTAAGLDEGVAEALDRAGARARRTLRAVAAWERPDGWTVAFQSPDAPALTFLAHFREPDAATAVAPPPIFNYAFAFAATNGEGA